MRYAENNQISHRQLRRQLVLGMISPFLLCAVGWEQLLGACGVTGILFAAALLTAYALLLVRLGPPELCAGKFLRFLLGLFYLAYILFTGAFLLSLLMDIVPRYLITGTNPLLLGVLSAAVCGLGMHKGLQKRGRMAEVSGGIVLGGILLLYLLSVSQGQVGRLYTTADGEIPLAAPVVFKAGYGMLAAFSGLGLLPLTLSRVENPKKAAKPVISGIWILAGLLAAGLILLQAAFGDARVRSEPYPILPLMAGANLPGDILGRFDVIWMGFLLYGLLFSIGSLLYYGTHILADAHLEGGRWLLAALMLLIAWQGLPGAGLPTVYRHLLRKIFFPGFLLATALLWLCKKRRLQKKKGERSEQV